MFLFDLIKEVRKNGFDKFVFDAPNPENPFVDPTPQEVAHFYEIVKDVKPFLVMESVEDLDLKDSLIPGNDNNLDYLDLPFKTCSFEAPKHMLSMGEGVNELRCILVNETGPRQYEIYVCVRHDGQDLIGKMEFSLEDMIRITNVLTKNLDISNGTDFFFSCYVLALKNCLHLLHKVSVGSISVRERTKLGKGHNKTYLKIKQLLVIAKKRSGGVTVNGKEVDFSHRWFVRGHWRKVKALGKNREGEYVVKGYTWVTEHAAGPENKPLVNKTRVVSQSDEE